MAEVEDLDMPGSEHDRSLLTAMMKAERRFFIGEYSLAPESVYVRTEDGQRTSYTERQSITTTGI